MTRKLYYEDPRLTSFSAKVISCEERDGAYCVTLDQTAFYPEGGGQAGDTGALSSVRVTDTQMEDGEIVHRCAGPLEAGTTVEGEIDWPRRFELMRRHAGEHIVSGLIHRLYGLNNVGFHMGAEDTTVDVSGRLTPEQLRQVERMANEIVARNETVRAWYPDPQTLAKTEYRCKKELTGDVRLVEIPGADVCACCGLHVTRTGEIGPILLAGWEHFHEGMRLRLLCGQQAVEAAFSAMDQCRSAGALLSAKPDGVLAAAERMAAELGQTKLRLSRMTRTAAAAIAEQYRGRGDVLLFVEGFDGGELGKLAGQTAASSGGVCAVFCPDGAGFRFALSGPGVRDLCARMTKELSGRGGGRDQLAQGAVTATERQIREFFRAAETEETP